MKPSYLISLRLLLICLFSTLVACGGGGSSSSTDDDDTDTTIIDTDGDGIADTDDDDDDGDGIPDDEDDFPLDETETTDTDGDGTGDNADVDDDNDGLIEISSLQQLDWVRNNLAGTALNDGTDSSDEGCLVSTGCIGYELTTHLDFDTNGDGLMDINDTYYDYDSDDSNSGWLPIGTDASRFAAVFEGNSYEIRNLYINRPTADIETSGQSIGLFGYASGAELRNIGLTGPLASITGYLNIGSLAGTAYDYSAITGSYATGAVTGEVYVGGLVGYTLNADIASSYATGAVTGDVGGGVGGFC